MISGLGFWAPGSRIEGLGFKIQSGFVFVFGGGKPLVVDAQRSPGLQNHAGLQTEAFGFRTLGCCLPLREYGISQHQGYIWGVLIIRMMIL